MRNEAAGRFFSTSCNGSETSGAPGPAWNKPRKLTGKLTSKTFAVTLTRPDASCGSINPNGSSSRTSGGTQLGSPVNCSAGRFLKIGSNGSAIFTSATRAVSETTAGGICDASDTSLAAARLSFVSHGSGFGFGSSSGAGVGAILNGIRIGAGAVAGIVDPGVSEAPVSSIRATTGASGEGKRFGTDGPLEAGTLSGAGASVPFSESLKGM